MGRFETVEAIGQAVDAEGTKLILCEAIDLRDACDESRLKAQARVRIHEKLASRGLVALPDVPEDQEHPVYVTRLSSPVDLLYKAFARPGTESLRVIEGALGGTGEVKDQQDAARQVAELIDEARSELDKVLGRVEVTE